MTQSQHILAPFLVDSYEAASVKVFLVGKIRVYRLMLR